jgi:RNA polymerase sigma-70 factor, ECF subfamily
MRTEIEQAVRLIQRKDPKSVEEALQLLQNTVFSFSMKVCGQRQDAEDTMQIEEAIRLSEEKYCSVGAMLKQ